MNTITVARPNKCLKCYACLVLAVPLLVLEGAHLVRELLGQVAHLSERERDGREKVSRGSRAGGTRAGTSNRSNHSGAVCVASRTSVLRWSTASVIACMGEESLLVWTCGFGDAERVSVVVDGRETRGGNPKNDTCSRRRNELALGETRRGARDAVRANARVATNSRAP